MIKVVHIPADNALPCVEHVFTPDLETLTYYVGGPLEVVMLDEPAATMYIHEEGRLAQLPLNQRATALVQRHCPSLGDFIVGDVLICGAPNGDGDDTTCPAFYLALASTEPEEKW